MRLYNGCPDSKLQAVFDNRAALRAKLHKKYPDARCVFFPMEGLYSVWRGPKQISKGHSSLEDAIGEVTT